MRLVELGVGELGEVLLPQNLGRAVAEADHVFVGLAVAIGITAVTVVGRQ